MLQNLVGGHYSVSLVKEVLGEGGNTLIYVTLQDYKLFSVSSFQGAFKIISLCVDTQNTTFFR